MEHRDRRGRFGPGNPGRPRGAVSGRHRTVQELDRLLAEEGNLETLRAGWQAALDGDPLRFWRTVVVPLLPQKMVLGIDAALEVEHQREEEETTAQDTLTAVLRAILDMPDGRAIIERLHDSLGEVPPTPSYPVPLQKDRFVTPPPNPGP